MKREQAVICLGANDGSAAKKAVICLGANDGSTEGSKGVALT